MEEPSRSTRSTRDESSSWLLIALTALTAFALGVVALAILPTGLCIDVPAGEDGPAICDASSSTGPIALMAVPALFVVYLGRRGGARDRFLRLSGLIMIATVALVFVIVAVYADA